MSFKHVLCLISLLGLIGCTRQATNSSRMRIVVGNMSSKVGAMGDPIPPGYKVCYAANVMGSDIPSTSRACGANLGAFAGFVEANGTLTVDVPKGTGRTVDLYAFLTPNTAAACPTMTTACDVATNCNTYKVATASGVSTANDVNEVPMSVNFPGLSANAVSEESPGSMFCSAAVTAGLTYSGQIVDGSLALIATAPFSPANFTVYKKTTSTNFEVITRSLTATESVSLTVRPQIRAISSDSSGQLYGMLSDGQLVAVTSSGDYTSIATCPFVSCNLPRWFKSFTIGQGSKVFGLDHGGGVWRVDGGGSLVSVTTLPPYVHQVVIQ